MESLFRLVLHRLPVEQDESLTNISLSQETSFQADLGEALQGENEREETKTAARRFMTTDAFIGSQEQLDLFEQLKRLAENLDNLQGNDALTNAQLGDAVEAAFGQRPDDLIDTESFVNSLSNLRDSLIAIKSLPEEHKRPIEALTNQLRDLEVIQKVADDDDFPGDGSTLFRHRRRGLLLPDEVHLKSIFSNRAREEARRRALAAEKEEKQKEASNRINRYKLLKSAIEELSKFDGDHFLSTPQRPIAGSLPPTSLRPTQIFAREMDNWQELSKLKILGIKAEIARIDNDGPNDGRANILSGNLQLRDDTPLAPRTLLSGQADFKPLNIAQVAFRLKPETQSNLSESTTQVLKERNLDPAQHSLDVIVLALEKELQQMSKEIDGMLGRPVNRSLKRLGTALVMVTTQKASRWNDIVVKDDPVDVVPVPDTTGVPETHGEIMPTGVAELLVVKQQLIGYESADIAHIENVLKGEKKEREHTRRQETEEFTFQETEVTTTEERELESTSRFEMSRETREVIRQDASLRAGLTVSGSYGPTVDFSASAEGAVSRSKEQATNSASRFSQDVTERSANRITERVLESSSLRVTNEVIERNMHSIDNTGGEEHISGVYQWVNKVYKAQMFNYGIRMMYDFMVPEPAAFLISALQEGYANATQLEKPEEFTLRPDQLSEDNYHTWVHMYGASDVVAPPEIYRTKSIDFSGGTDEEDKGMSFSSQVQIDDGYEAIYGTVGCVATIWEGNYGVDVVLGNKVHRFSGGDQMWSTPLSNERDSVPFAFITLHVAMLGIAVEVKCRRTARALLSWRLDTHAKLMAAYKARLAEYEEKLTALEVQAGIPISGRNPLLNLELMKDEFKKHCISILTDQHFELFDATEIGIYNTPEINLTENEAEGPYVRFFEQAFEWEQMTWLTYPYFWGKKSRWRELISYEDVDPVFNQFLKAGYCRVVLPVRPGFEGALDHFAHFGEIWNGGPLPPISSPLYLPIADEIAERLDRPGDEIPQGAPWLVRIPTRLVKLREDDRLPQWQQDENGEWVEVNPD